MMRVFLLGCSFLLIFSSGGWGKTYSCRDAEGRLHFTDNLQGLPAECLGQEQVVKEQTPDNLNYVPATEAPAGSGTRFQQSVRSAEREVEQAAAERKYLKLRAQGLQQRYREAQLQKRRAKRSWSYQSRAAIRQADLEIDQVQMGKQKLLAELSGARLSARERAEIEALLAEIASP